MKTPLSYYGGKQILAPEIIPLIPPHQLYAEPFAGGAAVLFGKKPSKYEVINDTNAMLVTFYEVLKNDFKKLKQEINQSLCSRYQYKFAKIIYDNPEFFDKIKKAWAIWFMLNTSFNNSLSTSFSFIKKIYNKCNQFSIYESRLQKTIIECMDAICFIKKYDSNTTFFYIDPPYVGAHQGHYNGYTQNDFNNLLHTLENIKGKFILSSYSNPVLQEIGKQHKWNTFKFNMQLSSPREKRRKTEVLTANYNIKTEFDLFSVKEKT